MTSYDVMTCHHVTSKQHDEKNYNVTKQIIELIPVTEINCLRIICLLGGSRRDKIRKEETRKDLGQEITFIYKIRKRRLTWFGHVTRMENSRLPAVALYGQVDGTRSRGRQPKEVDG